MSDQADRKREVAALRDDAVRRTELGRLIGSSIELKRRGGEYLGRCPFHAEKTASFTVVPKKGFFHCFGCGAHGDAIAWLLDYEGLAYAEAVVRLAQGAGLEVPDHLAVQARAARTRPARKPAPVQILDDDDERVRLAARIAEARRIFAAARAAGGTLVEDYLRARRIDPARSGGVPPTIRFDPRAYIGRGEHAPAMVCAVQAPDGRVAGIHRTYLRPDGQGHIGKRMLGQCWRGAVRLATCNAVLALGEGLESTLSAPAPAGFARWAVLSAGNMLAVRVPDHVRHVLLCCDADLARLRPHDGKPVWAGPDAAYRKAVRLRAMGIGATTMHPPLGLDFNDLAQRQRTGWLPGDRFKQEGRG